MMRTCKMTRIRRRMNSVKTTFYSKSDAMDMPKERNEETNECVD